MQVQQAIPGIIPMGIMPGVFDYCSSKKSRSGFFNEKRTKLAKILPIGNINEL